VDERQFSLLVLRLIDFQVSEGHLNKTAKKLGAESSTQEVEAERVGSPGENKQIPQWTWAPQRDHTWTGNSHVSSMCKVEVDEGLENHYHNELTKESLFCQPWRDTLISNVPSDGRVWGYVWDEAAA
jgi:hypothetical protein